MTQFIGLTVLMMAINFERQVWATELSELSLLKFLMHP